MKAHPGHVDVNFWACNALRNLAANNAVNQAAIEAAGGIMVCCCPLTPPLPTLPTLLLVPSLYTPSTTHLPPVPLSQVPHNPPPPSDYSHSPLPLAVSLFQQYLTLPIFPILPTLFQVSHIPSLSLPGGHPFLPLQVTSAPSAGATIALRARAAGHFLQMSNEKTSSGQACRAKGLAESISVAQFQEQSHWRDWERFLIVDAGHGEIALYNAKHRRFLKLPADESASGGGGELNSDQLPPREKWGLERWVFVPAPDESWALYNPCSKRFLRMEDNLNVNGNVSKVATKNDLPAAGTHERWDLLKLGGGIVVC